MSLTATCFSSPNGKSLSEKVWSLLAVGRKSVSQPAVKFGLCLSSRGDPGFVVAELTKQ